MSPKWNEADTIIWFPDNFDPPDEDQVAWLNTWLNAEANRTLIYVGRDFDAAPGYYRAIKGQVPADNQLLIDERVDASEAELARLEKPASDYKGGEWFARKAKTKHVEVKTLQGPWAAGIDASKVSIELNDRFETSSEQGFHHPTTLLQSAGRRIVSRYDYGSVRYQQSKLIVVTNGSFLLNVTLVNPEHRKLAARLIAEVGSPGKVVFLESGEKGPKIAENDPARQMSDGWDLMEKAPFDWILLHAAVLGIIFSFVRFPIFGVPRDAPPVGLSDFGKHVAALGELLQKSKARAFATARWRYYQEHVQDAASRKLEKEPAGG